jgi:hypothetical protein
MAAYGLAGQDPDGYELDHLISLELGGAPADPANLWPEPYLGERTAKQKDRLESELHRRVCAGTLPLADAQHRSRPTGSGPTAATSTGGARVADQIFDPQDDPNDPLRRRSVADPIAGAYGLGAPPISSQLEDIDPQEEIRAAQEDPFGPQPTRHAAYLKWQQMDPAKREATFQASIDQALTKEGITDPVSRERWKQAMLMVAKGDDRTHGENPDLNPYAQAYDLPDRPAQGVNPRLQGTPKGNATASSARGYFQFLSKGSEQAPAVWDLVRLPSRPGEEELPAESIFDPVANARGFIRAVNRASNYQHDPMNVYREKQQKQVWNPLLQKPMGTP